MHPTVTWLLALVGCDSGPPPAQNLEEALAQSEFVDPAQSIALRELLGSIGLTLADMPLDPADSEDGRHASLTAHGVNTLVLPTPPASLEPLARLPTLVHLELRAADPLPAFPTCTVAELRIAGLAADADLSALASCDQLERLYLHGELTSLSTLPPLPALEKLVVSHTPLTDLSGVSGHAKLSTLHVDHGQLTSLDGLHDVPSLTSLALPHQPFDAVPPLPHLPALKTLDLSHGQITEVSALQPVVHTLERVDLSDNPIEDVPGWIVAADAVSLSGTPVQESGRLMEMKLTALAEERLAAYEVAREEWRRPVQAELPHGHLSLRMARGGCESFGRSLSCEGHVARVTGAGTFSLRQIDPMDIGPSGSDKRKAKPVRLVASVDKGHARVFLKGDEQGHPYVDMKPGEEVAIRGHLVLHTIHQGFVLQAVDGPVEGFRYQVTPID